MQMKNLAVLVALPFALVACGGGGSSSSGGGGIVAPGASISSQFIDAPVKGLKVEKASGNGETGANGAFSCKAGEELTFWLKEIGVAGTGIALGSAFCGSHIYIDDLGADADKAGALIQSLSTGTPGSRTELDLSAFNATSYDLKAEVSDVTVVTDGLITSLISDVVANTNIEVAPVTVAEARKHIDSHLPAQDDATLASIADVEHTLRLVPLATNPVGYCWENIQVKVNLESIDRGESEGTAYRFNVSQYLAWDESEVPPTPSVCNGQEQQAGNVWYQCLTNPVSKIMTGRSVSGAKYEAYSFEIPQNAVAICQHEGGFEFNYTSGVNCVENEETPIIAANALKLDVGQGWNFNIAVTDSNYTVNFTENAVDIGAVLNADGKATAYTQTKFNCSYALVEDLDPGSSLAE